MDVGPEEASGIRGTRLGLGHPTAILRIKADYWERILEGLDWDLLRKEEDLKIALEGNPVGSLKRHLQAWRELGCSPIALDWIENGVPLIFVSDPLPGGATHNFVEGGKAMAFANKEISRLIYVGSVEVDGSLEEGFNFPLGAVPKPPDKFRLICDVTWRGLGPNAFMPKKSFKLEHLDDLLNQIGQDWFGFVFDLRAGFHHVEIREQDRRWLRFCWAGQRFRFVSMPFGPRHSPYFFTKLVKEFVKILRRGCNIQGCSHVKCFFRAAPFGVVIVAYVDDFCVCAKTRELALQIREEIIVPLMKKMGWIRALDKGTWDPVQRWNFLGLQVDTAKGLVFIPQEKLIKYLENLDLILSKKYVTVRELASLAGKIVSVMRAFAPALIHLRTTFALISRCTDGSQGWSERVEVSEAVRLDLEWLKVHLKRNQGRFAWRPARVLVLATDACTEIGWGATLKIGNKLLKARGTWSREQASWDIHILEMLAVKLAILAFANHLRNCNFQIIIDNQVCWHTLPKGSKIPELNKLIIEILDLALEMDAVMVDVLWIPSELNVVPDDLSRMVDVNDWTVRPEAWTAILGMWPQLTVDRFADEWNAKLPRFNSRFAHPSSEKANGLSEIWRRDELSYACPPLAMISRVMALVAQQETRAVVVIPEWPHQPWWPVVRKMAVTWLPLGSGLEVFQAGPSGVVAPHKNDKWVFWAVELDGRLK